MAITALEGKPWYVGAATGFVILVVLVFLTYWQLITPKNEEIAGLLAEQAELQAKIDAGRAAQQRLPQFREEVRRLELELDKLLRILPARRDTEGILRRVRMLTEQGDFEIRRIAPGSLTDQEFFSEWPITISVNGTYHDLALFFDRISRFSRIINIDNLTIAALGSRGGFYTLSASFQARTFIYKETPPEESVAGGGS